MPSVINQILFAAQTPVPPNDRIVSPSIDVDGTQSVSIHVGITSVNAAVRRLIHFGPAPNGGFPLARVNTFEFNNHLFVSLPTHGPQFFVVVENNSAAPVNCSGFAYAIRLVP